MQYIDNELATVTIEDASLSFIEEKFDKLAYLFKKINIKQIFIDIKDPNEFDAISRKIAKQKNIFLRTNAMPKNEQEHYIVKCDVEFLKNLKTFGNMYYQAEYSDDLIDILRNNKLAIEKVIISVPDDMLSADKIFQKLDMPESDIMFANPVLTTSFLRAHPCNVFLCSGSKCHNKKSSLPRQIFIKPDGTVYPHGLCEHIMGNINDTDIDIILSGYKDSELNKRFVELHRKMFVRYILSGMIVTIVPDNCLKRIYHEIK